MDEPLVSVIVCTYNRVDFLQKCLDSLLSQHDAPRYEIVVVDNNSDDATASFVRAYTDQSILPIHYVFEPVQGLSRAKNTGVKAARGKFVAFIDDDAIASDGWVHAIEEGASRYPEFAVQSGPVHGNFEIPKPAWLSSKIDFAISIGQFGDDFREKRAGEPVFGGNMAIRREVFDQIGGFLEDLGRTGLNLLAAEEVEYCERLRQHHLKILNNPKMEIWHWVPGTRLTRSYIQDRMYWNGRSMAVWDRIRERSIVLRALGRTFFTIPRDGIGMLLNWSRDDERFFYACQIKKQFGYISQVLEIINQSRQKEHELDQQIGPGPRPEGKKKSELFR
jgi:glycosyltransferase involved in cell wall biosynthesis